MVCLAVDLNYKYTQFKKRKECKDALVSGMRSGLKGGCTSFRDSKAKVLTSQISNPWLKYAPIQLLASERQTTSIMNLLFTDRMECKLLINELWF